MGSKDHNFEIWQRSKALSHSFWAHYAIYFDRSRHTPPQEENNDEEDAENQEYLEFIKITRKHQEERERLKKLETRKRKKKEDDVIEEYYKDISQVNTLIEDNLVAVPILNDTDKGQKQKDEELIKFYGSREAFEKIKFMEMCIDEHFNKKYLELRPNFWPVIPLNPKPYLNPINK